MNKITHFAFDYETTGLSPYKGAKVFTYILFSEMGDFNIYDKKNNNYFKNDLQTYFNVTSYSKICHNFKFELKFTQFSDILIPENTVWHDTMIMSQLLNNLWKRHSLDIICYQLCGYPMDIDKDVLKIGKTLGYDKVPTELMHEYQRRDGERTMLCFKTFYSEIEKKYLTIYNQEIEVIKITNEMENEGILIDKNRTLELIKWIDEEIYKLDNDIYNEYGEHLNFSRNCICKRILELKLNKKIGTTDKNFILSERAENPIKELDWILKKRSYTNGKSLLNSYLNFCDKNNKIHTNINTNVAKTGRQSTTSPSLMNMSKEKSLKNLYPIPMRKIVIPDKGYIFIDADWKGIEMRLGVQGTNSKRLINLLYKGFDFHDACAKNFYGDIYIKEQNKDIKNMYRSAAKNSRFAMFYGSGAETVSTILQLPLQRTKEGIERDKKEYPEFYEFMKECISFAFKNGYIKTFFGRCLQIYRYKAYTATDYKIQGSAAQIMKIAEINVYKMIQKKWKSEIKLLLPIHDQLLIKYPINLLRYKQDFIQDLHKEMTNFPEITIPLDIEFKQSCYNWNDSKELKII
jgi:DNA polymerase-1